MPDPEAEYDVMVTWETTLGHEETIHAVIAEKNLPAWKKALQDRVALNYKIQQVQAAAEDRCVETHRSQAVFRDVHGFFACIQAARDAAAKALLQGDATVRAKVMPLIKRITSTEVQELPNLPVGSPEVLVPTRRLDRFGFSREPLPHFAYVSAHPLGPADRFLGNAKVFYEEEWKVPTTEVGSLAAVARSLAQRKTNGRTACLVTHAIGLNIMLPLLDGGHPSQLPAHIDAFLASDAAYYKFVLFELPKERSVSSGFPQIADGVVRHIRNTDRPFYNGLQITVKLEDVIVTHALRTALGTGQFVIRVAGGASQAELVHQCELVLDLLYAEQASALALGDRQRQLNDKVVDWLNEVGGTIHTTTLDAEHADALLKNLSATTQPHAPLRRLRRTLTAVKQDPPARLCLRGCKVSRAALKSIARALGIGLTRVDAPSTLFHGYVPPVIRPLYIEDPVFRPIAEHPETKVTLDYWATKANVQPEVPEWGGATDQVRLDRYLDRALVLPGRTGDASVILARVLPPEPGGTNAGTGRVAMLHHLQGLWDPDDPQKVKIGKRAIALTGEWLKGSRQPLCPVMADDLNRPPTKLLFVHDPEFAQNLITAK